MCIIKSNTVCNSNEFYHDDEMKKNKKIMIITTKKQKKSKNDLRKFNNAVRQRPLLLLHQQPRGLRNFDLKQATREQSQEVCLWSQERRRLKEFSFGLTVASSASKQQADRIVSSNAKVVEFTTTHTAVFAKRRSHRPV